MNLSDRDNYLFLEAKGRGHYCGANLSVHNLLGYWWGEGDDMVMIDGDKWPPDIHGTGSEDWFNQAFGSQPHNAFLYSGVSYHNGIYKDYNERITVYRYHVLDPIIFEKSIRVSIEHGHANDRSDDYSSVAYWYQDLPNKRFPRLPPSSHAYRGLTSPFNPWTCRSARRDNPSPAPSTRTSMDDRLPLSTSAGVTNWKVAVLG